MLLSNADWAWPQAVTRIFQPRGVNPLVADTAGDIIRLVSHNRIHLAILDDALGDMSGVQALKIIRNYDRLMPCILLSQQVNDRLLSQALNLDVFSVVAKPVDINLLAGQIHRLFTKYYASNMFSQEEVRSQEPEDRSKPDRKIVIRWTISRKHERSNQDHEDPTVG